ncbi:MAG: DUF3365 domain-containing protein [Thermodesulfobacteriota bacterium]
MKNIIRAALLLLIALAFHVVPAEAGTYAEDKAKAEQYADELISTREAVSEILAGSETAITEQDFLKTYGKVYGRIVELQKKEGYIITFSAIKARNPQNAATPFEARLLAKFKAARDFRKFWTVTMVQDRAYSRLIKPVFAAKSCLVCHGPREKRPAFIVKRYPADKSSGFKEGELMGLISIYMPDEEDE